MVNKNYAKLLEDNKIEYAPTCFKTEHGILIPRKNDDNFFFERGYCKVIDIRPNYNFSTLTILLKSWKLDSENHTLTSEYEINEIEQPEKYVNKIKRYSKLKITIFCIEQNIWNLVKQHLIDTGYYDLFVMALYFLESDEYFIKGLESFAKTMIDDDTSQEEVDSLISTMKNFALDGYEYIEID